MPDPSKINQSAPARRPLHPAVAIGFVLFLVGCVAAVWPGEWRFAVTGLAVLLAAGVCAALVGARR
jgi:uncharacterized protein YjeT (DUF2065 family)